MEDFFAVLARCPLFAGVEEHDLGGVLACLGGVTVEVDRGEAVFREGDPARFVGIVLSGAVQVVREDYYGNRSVLTDVGPGELFAEVFACAEEDAMPVSAIARKAGSVMLLDCRRVLTGCAQGCASHQRIIHNLLKVVARKNLELGRKIRFMSQKTTKDKLMAYLLDQAKRQGRPDFTIPYDRQALADFLGVERSAMSAEIGKLRRAGVLESRGSWFCLKGL